jgi:5-formyltetrahydrofolate cyclo-ligase
VTGPKAKLREKYKQARLMMAPGFVEDDSLTICRRAINEIDWSKIKKVCAYDPIAELKEVDMKPLLKAVEYKYPDIKIKVLKQSRRQKVPKTKFDLILVPTLAFDKQKYRLGWGGGFYDRFLAGQPHAIKVGLCFANGFVCGGLPIKPHDVKLDVIITQERVYKS